MYKILRNNNIIKIKQIINKNALIHSDIDPKRFGKRKLLAYGRNGSACYLDSLTYPMPSIRWKEDTDEILALRKKEEGDWKKLSLVEKKLLYRASFCQTFSEFAYPPTGKWKISWGLLFTVIGLSLMTQAYMHAKVYDPLPKSFNYENQKAQLIRIILLMGNPVHGLSSKWDYENWKWKK